MKDLGVSQSEAEHVIRDINDYWIEPMAEDRLQRTILSQLPRIFT